MFTSQQTQLIELLKANGASLIGFGDISELDKSLTSGFNTAISIAIHYDSEITNVLDSNEDLFNTHLASLNEPMMKVIGLAENALHKWGYQFKSIPISIPIENNNQLDNLNQFPHKTAATRSGLGWIGKSALLITPEFGPRIKLCTILTNADFIKAIPINDNKCVNCTLCVNICPCSAIKNVSWNIGIKRDQLVDVYRCNEYRLKFITTIGRKHSCGLCIKVCKFGRCNIKE